MTLDHVAALMRERFTESHGTPVLITVEEWSALSAGIYLADTLEALLANPGDALLVAEAAVLIRDVRSGR